MKKAASPATLVNPVAFNRLAFAAGNALTVDESTGILDMGRLAWAMKGIGGDGAVRTTVPVEGTGSRPGAGSVVLWDEAGAEDLFSRLREDREVLLQVGVYAGVPAANRAFAVAQKVLAELPEE